MRDIDFSEPADKHFSCIPKTPALSCHQDIEKALPWAFSTTEAGDALPRFLHFHRLTAAENGGTSLWESRIFRGAPVLVESLNFLDFPLRSIAQE